MNKVCVNVLFRNKKNCKTAKKTAKLHNWIPIIPLFSVTLDWPSSLSTFSGKGRKQQRRQEGWGQRQPEGQLFLSRWGDDVIIARCPAQRQLQGPQRRRVKLQALSSVYVVNMCVRGCVYFTYVHTTQTQWPFFLRTSLTTPSFNVSKSTVLHVT